MSASSHGQLSVQPPPLSKGPIAHLARPGRGHREAGGLPVPAGRGYLEAEGQAEALCGEGSRGAQQTLPTAAGGGARRHAARRHAARRHAARQGSAGQPGLRAGGSELVMNRSAEEPLC